MSLYNRNAAPGLYSIKTGELIQPWCDNEGLGRSSLGGSGLGYSLGSSRLDEGFGGRGLRGGSLRRGGFGGPALGSSGLDVGGLDWDGVGDSGLHGQGFQESGFGQSGLPQGPSQRDPFKPRIFPPKKNIPSPFNTKEIDGSPFHPRFEIPAYEARQRGLAQEQKSQLAAQGLAHRLRLADLAVQEQFSYENRRGQTPCLTPYCPVNPRPVYRF